MKKYIKMNNNDEHLSLGNLFRLIKNNSTNKNSALQTDLFCDLFTIESINDTTVNNYCIGARSIGNSYKQIFANYKKRFKDDKNILLDIVIGIINCMDGNINNPIDRIEFINSSDSFKNLVKKLYSISKNDYQVDDELSNRFSNFINDNNYYECFINMLFFIILEKKQPLYDEYIKKDIIDTVLSDSSISSVELQEYLSLKLREGIHFDYSMKLLASKGNTYANYDIGSNEFYGYFKGYPRYDVAYKYLLKAANRGHANACYMIGTMYLKGYIGGRSNDDLACAYNFFEKSINGGNIAALNSIGNMYYDGIYPLQKDVDKALKFYIEASNFENIFAYNNLGKYYENKKDFNKAFEYFLKAADLRESWACNKVGEYYRLGIITKDMKKAFDYYTNATLCNYQTTCYYAYYNLAKYFYKDGYLDVVINKDLNKYEEYLKLANEHNILDASVDLFIYYIDKYIKYKDTLIYDIILKLKKDIETHELYNENIYNNIKSNIKKIEESNKISLSNIFN